MPLDYSNFDTFKTGYKIYDENGKELEVVKIKGYYTKMTITCDYEVVDEKVKKVFYIHLPYKILE